MNHQNECSLLLILFLMWMLCASEGSLALACPAACACRWKSGKETVICTGQGLRFIPDNIDSSTQVLDMSDNPLRTLSAGTFVKLHLLNLQRIYLSKCRLAWLHRSSFNRLNNLVELDLSYNLLKQIPSDTFVDYPELRRLNLANNPIERVQADAFAHLVAITNLELSQCQIEWLDANAFRGLSNLMQLKLDGNHLTTMEGTAFTHLTSLHGIELHNNPWQCDCTLLSLYTWLTKHKIHSSSPVVCDQPSPLHGLALNHLTVDKLACKPRGSYVSKQAKVNEGDDAILTCSISGNPEPKVHWIWQDRVINNYTYSFPTSQIFIIQETGTLNKTSILKIIAATKQNSGRYQCVAENNAGQFTSTTNLEVKSSLQVKNSQVYVGHVLGIFMATTLVTTVCITVCFLLIKNKYLKNKYSKVIVTYGEEEKPLNSSYCKRRDNDQKEVVKKNSSVKSYSKKCHEVPFVVNDIRRMLPNTNRMRENNRNDIIKPHKQQLKDKIANSIKDQRDYSDNSLNTIDECKEQDSLKSKNKQTDTSTTCSSPDNEVKVQFDHVTVESKWKENLTSKYNNEWSIDEANWFPALLSRDRYNSPKFATQDNLKNTNNICVYNANNDKQIHLSLQDLKLTNTQTQFVTFLCDTRETDL